MLLGVRVTEALMIESDQTKPNSLNSAHRPRKIHPLLDCAGSLEVAHPFDGRRIGEVLDVAEDIASGRLLECLEALEDEDGLHVESGVLVEGGHRPALQAVGAPYLRH